MSNLKNVKKELAKKRREIEKLEKEMTMTNLSNKMSYVADAIFTNKHLCDTLTSIPGDEAKLVLSKIINSSEFIKLFDDVLKCESLSNLRKTKLEKAEKRKAVKGDNNQPTSTSFGTSEQFALSEQAEMPEQTMKPDYTGDISNY